MTSSALDIRDESRIDMRRARQAHAFVDALSARDARRLTETFSPEVCWFGETLIRTAFGGPMFGRFLLESPLSARTVRMLPVRIAARIPAAALTSVMGVPLEAAGRAFFADVQRDGNVATIGLVIDEVGVRAVFDAEPMAPLLRASRTPTPVT